MCQAMKGTSNSIPPVTAIAAPARVAAAPTPPTRTYAAPHVARNPHNQLQQRTQGKPLSRRSSDSQVRIACHVCTGVFPDADLLRVHLLDHRRIERHDMLSCRDCLLLLRLDAPPPPEPPVKAATPAANLAAAASSSAANRSYKEGRSVSTSTEEGSRSRAPVLALTSGGETTRDDSDSSQLTADVREGDGVATEVKVERQDEEAAAAVEPTRDAPAPAGAADESQSQGDHHQQEQQGHQDDEEGEEWEPESDPESIVSYKGDEGEGGSDSAGGLRVAGVDYLDAVPPAASFPHQDEEDGEEGEPLVIKLISELNAAEAAAAGEAVLPHDLPDDVDEMMQDAIHLISDGYPL